jgi:hypothetical protein
MVIEAWRNQKNLHVPEAMFPFGVKSKGAYVNDELGDKPSEYLILEMKYNGRNPPMHVTSIPSMKEPESASPIAMG